MCKAFEETRDAARYQEAVDIALKLLERGKYTIEEIAEDTGLTIEKIQELAGSMTA